MAWLLTTAGLQKSLTEEMIGAIVGNRGQKNGMLGSGRQVEIRN